MSPNLTPYVSLSGGIREWILKFGPEGVALILKTSH